MSFVQYFLRDLRPILMGKLTRFIYKSENVKFGRGLRCDGIPIILVDKGAEIEFGNYVTLRSSVEIRCHGNSRIYISDDVRIDKGVRLLSANEAILRLHDGVRIGLFTVVNGGDSITIGANSLISGYVYLQASMHGYKKTGLIIKDQGYNHAPIELKQDCWLGAHVVVMPGVILEEGVVVGSNAVVRRSFSKYSVIGGIPAKIIKHRE